MVTKTPSMPAIPGGNGKPLLILESLTAITVAFILSIAGVSSVAAGNVIFVLGLRQSILIELGLIDWTVLLLLDFLCVFTTWIYLTVRGGQLSTLSYMSLAGAIFPIIFFGNAVKIAVEIFIAANSSVHSVLDSGVATSMDGAGLGVLFGFALLTTFASCFLMTTVLRGRVKPFDPSGFFGKKL